MYKIWKFLFDEIVAVASFVLLLPLFLVVGIFIKLSSKGPVLYSQTRLGKDAKPFEMYKFRTMYVEDDQIYAQDFVKDLIDGKYGEVGREPLQKLSNDPRITPFGKFLRMTAIDELPQIANVIKGDMSLIGPRPTLPYEYTKYKEWQKERFSVKPGITGLWQVTGRSSTTFDQMVEKDIEYARHKSSFIDLEILLKTIYVVLSKKGAY